MIYLSLTKEFVKCSGHLSTFLVRNTYEKIIFYYCIVFTMGVLADRHYVNEKIFVNEQTIDDLIMNLGSPDSFIENEDIKYLSYQWGTTIVKITFFAKNNIIFDALYDPTGSSSEIDGGGVGASLTMKLFGKLGAKSGKKLLASEIKEM